MNGCCITLYPFKKTGLAVFCMVLLFLIGGYLNRAESHVSEEKCYEEMNFWNRAIAYYVSGHQLRGTDFGVDYQWPACWPDCLGRIPISATSLFFETVFQGQDHIPGFLRLEYKFNNIGGRAITYDYWFLDIPLFIDGIQTNILRLTCYISDSNDLNLEVETKKLEWLLNNQNNNVFRYDTIPLSRPTFASKYGFY